MGSWISAFPFLLKRICNAESTGLLAFRIQHNGCIGLVTIASAQGMIAIKVCSKLTVGRWHRATDGSSTGIRTKARPLLESCKTIKIIGSLIFSSGTGWR